MTNKKILASLVVGIIAMTISQGTYAQTTKEKQVPTQKLTYDRFIQPAGKLIVMGDSTKENHALDGAISADKKWLAVEERYSVVFIDAVYDKVKYVFKLKNIPELKNAMSTYSGIQWHTIGNKNYVFFSTADVNNNSFVVQLEWDGGKATLSKLFQFNAVPPAEVALPNEVLICQEKGCDYLFAVLNGNNQLVKKNLQTGETIWTKNAGVAPYGIVKAKSRLYVTNWAGRIPDKDDPNIAGVPWGMAKIDSATAGTREGSVSVFEPETGKLLAEIVVGLHPNKIIASPDEKFVYVTNSNSDMVSVIATSTNKVTESISLRLQKNNNAFFGDMPNAMAITDDGKTLFVANGMDNAISVIKLGKMATTKGKEVHSITRGYIPTAAFPSSVCMLKNKLYVTNLESFGSNIPFSFVPNHLPVYNSHHELTSISVIDIPNKKQLAEYSKTVIACNQLERIKDLKLPVREGVLPKPVPERIGEPSVFKHVLYIIKENRTYDQVLGDVKKGNGDSTLCVFGEKVTPNLHQMVDQFQLMDNFMVSGKCSAEGHSWADASIVTDYIEKNVRAWFRSYPHVLEDALVYPPTGFIWDNARKNGISSRIYGEAATPIFEKTLTWSNIYADFLAGKQFVFKNKTTLNTENEILSSDFPGYDGHKIPDILRAKSFIDELKQYESEDGDALPKLMVMALPNDHTAGTRPNFPTPRAMVADNDLALGQIVDAVSHSKFWKNTVIFVVEDDSQDGWDHVSAYRTTAVVISPYSKFTNAIHTAYNQPSVIRTIEQILGLPPMNIQDAIALPMFDCFNVVPDYSPFSAVKNQIPLDELNPPLAMLTGKSLHFAKLSLDSQFDGIDSGNDEIFNQIIWYAMMKNAPYPEKFSMFDED